MNFQARFEKLQAAKEELAQVSYVETSAEESGFGLVFENEIKPVIMSGIDEQIGRVAESKRRQPYLIAGSIFIAAVYVFFLFASSEETTVLNDAIEYLVYVLVALITWAYWPLFHRYTASPALIAGKVTNRFGFTYKDNESLPTFVQKQSPIFPPGNQTKSLCHISGKIQHVVVDGWLIVRSKKEGKSTRTTFHGWFLKLQLPVSFPSTTFIQSAHANYARQSNIRQLEPVHLEDPEFSRLFDVSSSDQVEARVILSPDVIHHLAEYAKTFAGVGGLTIHVEGNLAYMTIPWGHSSFQQWTPHEPKKTVEQIKAYFDEMRTLIAFIRDIDAVSEAEGHRGDLNRNLRNKLVPGTLGTGE